jgi:hypothetical protein
MLKPHLVRFSGKHNARGHTLQRYKSRLRRPCPRVLFSSFHFQVYYLLGGSWLIRKMGPPFKIEDWQQAAAEKRQLLRDSIPQTHLLPNSLQEKAAKSELLPSDDQVLTSGTLSSLDIEITNIDDAVVLLERIASRKYTSVQVAEAFCKRASIAQQLTNCLTEILYDQALERARWLDERLEREGKTVGILHGLPVSIKVICLRSLSRMRESRRN